MKPRPSQTPLNLPSVISRGLVSAVLLNMSACHLLSSQEQSPSSEDSNGEALHNINTPDQSAPDESSVERTSTETGSRKLVARVNGEGILEVDFNAEYEERVRTYRARKRPVPPRLEYTYKVSVMNQLINDTLVRQELKRQKVTLNADELTAAMSSYKARFRSEKNFLSYLKQSNKSKSQVIDEVSFDAKLDKLISQTSSIDITEKDILNIYNDQRESRYTEPAKARVNHILISIPQNAPKKSVVKAKRTALKVAQRAKAPNADFKALAKEVSQDSKTKMRGGDLGLLTKRGTVQFSEAFEAVAAKLPLKTPSEPVLTPLGWHILKVTDRQPRQLRVSHILIKGPKAEQSAKKLLKRALSEPFADLARSASQDELSRVRGGDLDFLHNKSAHRLGEQFKAEVFKLNKGDLSVIKSALGHHVVLITDMRPMRVRVSHILLAIPEGSTQQHQEKVGAEARSLYEELKAELSQTKTRSNAFTRLARRRSDDKKSSLRGGDIGPFYIGGEPHFSKAVEEAIFTMKPGEVSAPLRSPFGFHILKVKELIPQKTKSLNDVRAELQTQLRTKLLRRQKALFMQRLKSEAKIERYLTLKQ